MNLGCSSFPVGVQVVSALLRLGKLYDKGLLLLADTVKQVSYPESNIALTKISLHIICCLDRRVLLLPCKSKRGRTSSVYE